MRTRLWTHLRLQITLWGCGMDLRRTGTNNPNNSLRFWVGARPRLMGPGDPMKIEMLLSGQKSFLDLLSSFFRVFFSLPHIVQMSSDVLSFNNIKLTSKKYISEQHLVQWLLFHIHKSAVWGSSLKHSNIFLFFLLSGGRCFSFLFHFGSGCIFEECFSAFFGLCWISPLFS